MILFIDNSLVENIQHEVNFTSFFMKLMISYTEGKHIIIISPVNVRKILLANVLDESTEIILRHYSAHNKASLEMLNLFDKVVRIIPNSDHEIIYSSIVDRKEFSDINIDRFIDTSNFQKTILLGENGNDIKVYGIIAEYYKHINNNGKFILSYKSQTGGGSTTVKEYETIFSEGDEFCLCLLDSDKRTPHHSIGDTAKKVQQYHTLNLNLKCSFYIVDVLEIENLLPRMFYIENYEKKDINKKGIMQRIEAFEKLDASSFFHNDFKIGLKKMDDYPDDQFKIYWSELSLGVKPLTQDFGDDDFGYFKGYGNKIVSDFLSFTNEEVFKFVNNDIVSEEWLKIGKRLSSYIYGTPKIRAI